MQFVRGDMESGRWREEEYSVNATFPYDPEKRIVFGMRMSFLDPATGVFQFFEVKNVTKIDPDAYQQIIAEHIVVSELSDDHINNTEITDKTPAQALTTVLTGTLWAVGNSTVSDVGSVDIARGSVWQAVNAIKQNYNCYIEPRVTVDAAGNITGRYLDITPTTGTFRGLRLSIRRNMSDSSVTYDDSETYTALYGYGGSVDVPQTGGQDTTEELTFKDVVWTATAEHPAKPAGQTYIEDPAKTALYGRNGRPRYGYYQNSDIKDAEVLLAKTWEALKKTCNPKISITGTVTDLRRLGMPDVFVRLHDIAVVEIEDTGEKLEKQIIKNEVDLVDESANLPEIGDYIPNIIYINREEAKKTGGGGGGGGHGQSPREHEDGELYTEWKNLENKIGLVVGTYNGGYKVEAGEITLAINDSGTPGSPITTALINASHVNISATDDVYTLAGDLEHDANGKLIVKSGGGLWVQRTESGSTATVGVWDKGNLTGGVMVQQINGQSAVKISGNVIDINGSNISISADRIDINGVVSKLLTEQIACVSIHTTGGSNLFDGRSDMDELHISNDLIMGENVLTYGGNTVSWQTLSVVTGTTVETAGARWYATSTNGTSVTGNNYFNPVTKVTASKKTIHFMGYPDS